MPNVAVIILNWNGRDLLAKFLPSLIEHTSIPNCRLVVADNNSGDESVMFVKESFPEIEVLEFDRNYGFAEGYNKAVEIIKDEYVVLLNSDVEVCENWLQPLIQVFAKEENVGAVMPKILDFKRKEYFEYAGAAGGFIDKYGFAFCRGRVFDFLEKDEGQYDKLSKVFWVSGACFVTKRAYYLENGGLDGRFFAHMEEIDLCWRMKNRGLNLFCEPASKVFHVGGASLSASNPKKTFLNFRNNLYLLYKNLPKQGFYSIFFLRLILDGIAGAKFLLSCKTDDFFAVLDAHVGFYSNIGKMKKSREENLENAINQIHPEIFNGSIVKEYFLGKTTIFSKLNFRVKNE
ncbi:MAG: glycosyltransferase family 2 protein [Bacteroidales bacterium]|nr:glycosyltransferase family 2 protein [Bacteroidales bacterium]